MARTDAAILAAQKTNSVSPIVTVEYYTVGRPSDAGGAWNRIDNLSSTQRVIAPLDHTQEPFGATCTIYLSNADSAFDSYDLKGLWVRVGRGIGSDISYPPYLKCYAQDFVSSPDGDKDIYVIHCHGAWNILAAYTNPGGLSFNTTGSSAGWTYVPNKTGKEIVDYILELAGLDLGADISLDTKIDVWKPQLDMNKNMSGMDMILFAMYFFRCSLLPRTDNMHLLLTNTGDTYTYITPQDGTNHPFKSGQTRSFLYRPMKITVESLSGVIGSYADGDWTSDMGSASWGDVYNILTGAEDTVANCELLAQAEVERRQSQTESGSFITYIANSLQELYDTVTITDNRGNISGSGVVGGIYFHYNPGIEDSSQLFYDEIRIGGMQRAVTPEMQALVDKFAGSLTQTISGQQITQGSIDPITLRQAGQRFTIDVTFDTGDAGYTWQIVKWLAGTVIFSDGTELTIDAGTLNISTAYPGAPDTPVWLYFIEGNTTLQHTQTRATATGKDRGIIAVVQRAATSADGKAALFYAGAGKVGLINATIIVVDTLSSIVADIGTVTAGTINLSSGAVVIDSEGVTIKDSSDTNQWLRFKDSGGNLDGVIYLSAADNFFIVSENDLEIVTNVTAKNLYLHWKNDAGTSRKLVCDDNDFYPVTTNVVSLGISGNVFLDGYFTDLHIADDLIIAGDVVVGASGSIDLITNNGFFYPPRLSQSPQPTPATNELLVWRDTDDNKTYLVYNDTDEGVRKVELI